ncbi:protein retinal degeneration B-like isoform X1 [Dreissena polymorpha]|uniref:protein retinal degeneration B-like isoform X1 n=1 Tax=Dreissena polymorpha TaxID=45954 RepID=UPI002263EED0|nr:protein retinal degeneration B-like isoform X1 [Dreissena polymorpha]XP_052247569.1 protein retinal degeneration B-like isoform X1 [Dreissena polymorpha]
MLVKEYRISLPMSVEEYRIAQLYMIQKKSREESHGAGSGVEIIENQPYTDGPGGSGQYTYKIYHIGSHLPGWFRAILPKSALRVEEEAWNAYPYTKTRYKCPFVEKFVLEVETRYLNDGGEKDNLFGLKSSELKERTVDYIDIVKDTISSSDYRREEDPKIYQSNTTQRGPLQDNWREEYAKAARTDPNKKIMTAYKLCRVEFRYWGMQNKIERFIHDIGLRKTMLRAHRQAWCWQDEYYGLKLEDIRRLELETQLALQEKMAGINDNDEFIDPTKQDHKTSDHTKSVNITSVQEDNANAAASPTVSVPVSKQFDHVKSQTLSGRQSPSPSQATIHSSKSKTKQMSRSKSSLDSSHVSDWRFQSLEQLQESSSDEDDEFFDAEGIFGDVCSSDLEMSDSELDQNVLWGLGTKSSSLEMLSVSNDEFADARSQLSFNTDNAGGRRFEKLCQKYSLETGRNDKQSTAPSLCKTDVLFLVVHGGSMLDTACDSFNTSKRSDYNTFKTTFDTVVRNSYPAAKGHVAFRLVPCPQMCADALNVLSSLSPFGSDSTPHHIEGNLPWSQEFVPLGALGLFSACSPEYQDHVNSVVAKANLVYMDFLQSDDGRGFTGQVCLVADSTGSILMYDALCRSRSLLSNCGSHYSSRGSDLNVGALGSSHTLCDKEDTIKEEPEVCDDNVKPTTGDAHIKQTNKHKTSSELLHRTVSEGHTSMKAPLHKTDSMPVEMRKQDGKSGSVRVHVTQSAEAAYEGSCRRTSSESLYESIKLEFEVGDFFMLGSPLGLVLAYRRMFAGQNKEMPERPECQQMYNLFHASDPSAFRLEPLVNFTFRQIPPIKVSRYNKFPMGHGESIQIVETMCQYINMFLDQYSCEQSGENLVDQASIGSELLVSLQRQSSVSSNSIQYCSSGQYGSTFSNIANVSSKWWGNKRLDYVLYCPEVLHSFPVRALPPLFHASFWESTDVVAFVLRQLFQHDIGFSYQNDELQNSVFMAPDEQLSQQPKEKWQKRRTMYKIKNLQPNHRGNDVLVVEDGPQKITAKFMYGPLDMTSLSGEKTDIHVMSGAGEWMYMGTEMTDGHGRLSFTIPEDKQLCQGIYPVRLVVRVDHTTADLFLAVLPPKTETVIFSIDGSFTASVSIMGKDPKVKPGAVDVVRRWQELGYMILYVTARPDMQHTKVVGWLAQHNFPHGMVAFMDGFSKDPLKQKFNYIKTLQKDAELSLCAAYGSSKDINGYRELGLDKTKIFIVGKSSKKQQNLATFISDGYAAHLEVLMTPGGSRPASGNAVFLLHKACFCLPSANKRNSKARQSMNLSPSGSQKDGMFTRQESHASQTLITVGEQGNTLLQSVQPSFGAAVRARGTSPRPKLLLDNLK